MLLIVKNNCDPKAQIQEQKVIIVLLKKRHMPSPALTQTKNANVVAE